jgi:glucosamine kinase
MGFFVGIDAGGSKTEGVLADEAGVVLARASGAGANLRRVSRAELRATLSQCLEELRRTAGLPAIVADAVCAGFAGAGDAEARAQAHEVLTELLRPHRLYVVGDMEVALEAAVGAGLGVILVAGTGSIAYGRNGLGRQARAGGRGPGAGDEGSGYDIGRCAVEAALRARCSKTPATPLTRIVLQSLGVERAEALEGRVRPEAATELAALVPAVVEASRAGDATASGILAHAAQALAGLALEVLEELDLLGAEVRIAVSGGVFAASEAVFAGVRAAVAARAPRAAVEPLAVTPAEGAVRLAQRLWLQGQAAAPAVER